MILMLVKLNFSEKLSVFYLTCVFFDSNSPKNRGTHYTV